MIDIHFEGTEPARLNAIQRSASRLMEKIRKPVQAGCVWNLADSLWPALSMPEYADKPIERVALRLLPLSRIGQMEGKSGSLVLIGFFADAANTERPHSHPVVVKTLSLQNRDKLREEYDNAQGIKPYAYDQKDMFAIPIDFDDEQRDFTVLWSIFSPTDSIWPHGAAGEPEHALKVDDLRTPLEEGADDIALPIMESAFRLLANLHHRFNKSRTEEREFGSEYERYLRKLDEGVWGAEWREAWAESDTRLVEDAGGQFVNPFWLLDRV
jgi:hypothetical protein